MVCSGSGCASNAGFDVRGALENEIRRFDLEDEVLVASIGCMGVCAQGPIMIVQPDGIFYQLFTKEDIPHLVEEHLLKGRPVKRLMYTPSEWEMPIPKMSDIGFFAKQRLIVLRNRGLIDPENIEEYIARDGYRALAKALTSMSPEEIVQEVKDSGLRGRGGAGFPTGRKWELARSSPGDEKYIICNADEGDPGAYMDRCIIESDPHSVLEGMTIGAKAIGSSHGFVYIRNEYPLALERLTRAVEQARDYGLLGKNMLGTDFDFEVSIHRGAGAFVCGEETALMASIEGRAGRPRPRPPYPAEKGLWGKPTNINNVETWANVPPIILRKAKWFSDIGTETSKGTKVFSLVGKINNTGLVEVPMGIPLREIIYDIGGGIPDNKKFKAVQTGGPSGGCIPSDLLDLQVDYEELAKIGSIMGSGGMVVMDETTCMVDVARYFLTFTLDESCGQCTPCREGIERMLDILTEICEGRGKNGDVDLLEELGHAIVDGSLCGLGSTAPNPVLSTIRYFRNEYEAHIRQKRCSAAVCTEIVSSPCQHTCPIDTEAAVYIALAAQGKFKEAFDVVRKDNPLPSVCGRVCHHPCEYRCKASEGGDPIAIRTIKRFLTDFAMESNIESVAKPERSKEERVAVIGSGPAGLTCAYYLTLNGYGTTVFEALPEVGGMLAIAIPHHRLPREVLSFDVESIKNAGVKIETNTALGEDISIDGLLEEGFKAIFIAIGAHKSLKLNIPNEDAEGVLDSIEFLKAVNLGKEVKIGKKVGIIGGGNAAVDAARVANRLPDCEKVTIVYRRTRAEMPAFKEEVDEGIEEGIDIQFLAAPVKVLTKDGKVTGIECIRMKLGDIDKSGRRRPVPIKGSEFTVELDTLIPAISERPDISFMTEKDQLKTSKWDTVVVDEETLTTSRAGVFAGGDVVTGPGTVVEAISAGKTAAESINKFLRGQSLAREYEVTRPSMYVESVKLTDEEIEQAQRPEMPALSAEERMKNFKEVTLGFTEEIAIKEARRCLRCDLGTEDAKKFLEESKHGKSNH